MSSLSFMNLFEAGRSAAMKQEWSNTIDFIKTNCQPWLEACGDNFIWRGVKRNRLIVHGDHEVYAVYDVRKDRSPSDSKREAHDYMDKIMVDMLGWAGRSEGLFVTGNYHVATDYGKPCMIFPIGEFEFIWNTRVDDAINAVHWTDLKTDDENKDYIYQEYGLDLSDKDIVSAIKSGHEIMVRCDKYVAILPEHATDFHTIWKNVQETGDVFRGKRAKSPDKFED
jgi:hypothetical protein